jgi:proteic killer suppression protein
MIVSFRDRRAARLLGGERVRELANIEKPARGRLIRLDAATSIEDLRAVRGNRLEALDGNRKGQFSIRINDQYRICFTWNDKEKGASNVEITDYH